MGIVNQLLYQYLLKRLSMKYCVQNWRMACEVIVNLKYCIILYQIKSIAILLLLWNITVGHYLMCCTFHFIHYNLNACLFFLSDIKTLVFLTMPFLTVNFILQGFLFYLLYFLFWLYIALKLYRDFLIS